jgi:hypothetical protein
MKLGACPPLAHVNLCNYPPIIEINDCNKDFKEEIATGEEKEGWEQEKA